MSNLLARKVTKSKWDNQLDSSTGRRHIISADTITSCLRTSGNTLSVWNVDDIGDAVLALACVNTSLSSIDIIILEKDFFNNINIDVENIPAKTPVEDLINKHCDIVDLDYDKLGIISKEIANKISENASFITRYTKKTVTNIIKKAIQDKRITIDMLNEELQTSYNNTQISKEI